MEVEKRMNGRIIRGTLCLLVMTLLLGGCGNVKTVSKPDTNDWQSWRIGVPLAWSSDYYLTTNADIPSTNLYRYDSAGDCIMALKFGYIDAIAVDSLYSYEVLQQYSEFEVLDEPIGDDAIVAYVTPTRADLLEEINRYIPVFRDSEAYEDLYARANAEDFVPDMDIPVCEDGEVIRVGIDTSSGNYPYTYYDFGSSEPQGVDIEFIAHFAAEYGYRIEWVDGSWDAGAIAVTNGDIDIFVCAVSEYYVEETELTGACLCSDAYFDLELVLIVRSDES